MDTGTILVNRSLYKYMQPISDKPWVYGTLFTLFSRCAPNNHVYLTIKEIADHTGLKEQEIADSLDLLEDNGMITQYADGDYYINPEIAHRPENENPVPCMILAAT